MAVIFTMILVFVMGSALHGGYVAVSDLKGRGYDLAVVHYSLYHESGCHQIFNEKDIEIDRHMIREDARCYQGGVEARRAFNHAVVYSRGFNFNNAVAPYIFLPLLTGLVLAISVSGVLTEIGRRGAKKFAIVLWLPVSLVLYIIVFGNYSYYGHNKEAKTVAYPLYYSKIEQSHMNLPYTYIGKLLYLDRNYNNGKKFKIRK